MKTFRQFDLGTDGFFFAAQTVALDFDKDVVRAENSGQIFHGGLASGQSHQPAGKFRQLIPTDPASALFIPQMGAGQKLAKVFVAGARLHQNGQNGLVLQGQFRAHDGTNAQFPRARKKSGRAVKSVAVAQRDGRHLQVRGALGQFSGKEAPRKKLKALRQWSSTYSVIDPFHETAAAGTDEPQKRTIESFHVPFFAGPAAVLPPIA